MSKWALILGGSSGIGLATAQKLGKSGWNLLVVHRDRRSVLVDIEAAFSEIRESGARLISFNFDATSQEKINEHLPQFRQALGDANIDLMLHSVSRGNLKPFVSKDGPELNLQDLQLTIDAMALNVLTWASTLLKNNFFANPARIITLTSMGNDRVWEGYGAIALAKSTLETLSRYLAVELAPHNIRVNTIQAGVTLTPSLKMIPSYKKMIELVTKNNPMGRMTQPEDVANAIYLLSLDEANWINGSTIHVDGGEHLL
jgi:enoyl-[acyl-carrier protein] reductase III